MRAYVLKWAKDGIMAKTLIEVPLVHSPDDKVKPLNLDGLMDGFIIIVINILVYKKLN